MTPSLPYAAESLPGSTGNLPANSGNYSVMVERDDGANAGQRRDTALVRAARAGDRRAFAVLVERHRPLLAAVCQRFVGPVPLADDAAQEAVLRAMLSLDRLRRPDRFGPWLAGIGLNLCRFWLRERARAPESWEALAGGCAGPEPVDRGPDPAEAAATADLAARVRAAVSTLPPGQRAAVLLHYLAGMTQAEVAAALGAEPGAVKARLHKARRALRQQLHATWMEDTMPGDTGADRVAVRVADVWRVEREGSALRHAIVLEDAGGDHLLPIWVGQGDADAVVDHLERLASPRPPTHDFTANLLRAAHVRVSGVLLDRLVDGVFYATVLLDGPGGGGSVDARPSDAINLALRAGAPIGVHRGVLAAAGRTRAEAASMPSPGHVQRRAEIAAALQERRAASEAEMQREIERVRRERETRPKPPG
jgi:RNA polymerase sigma factor (sigma-70 family)